MKRGRVEKRERQGAGPRAKTGYGSRWLWEWVKSISVAVVLFLVIRTFVVEAFGISSGSMERTILTGDFLLVNKAAYGAQVPFTSIRLPAIAELGRWDVIVLDPPVESDNPYVKRLVGMPGDRVAMRGGTLYVNGVRQEEEYVQHLFPGQDYYDPQFEWQRAYLAPDVSKQTYRPTRDNWGPIVVPEGSYFVMGDNRDNSQDSRHWGFVHRGLIKGRPLFIYYSFDRNKLRPLPWITEVRWGRVGNLVR